MQKSRKNEPKRIRDLIGSVLDNAGGPESHPPEAVAAVAAWPLLAGERLAAVSRAVSLNGGKLLVEVTAPAWKQELLFSRQRLIRELNAHLGADLVGEMVIIVRDFLHGKR